MTSEPPEAPRRPGAPAPDGSTHRSEDDAAPVPPVVPVPAAAHGRRAARHQARRRRPLSVLSVAVVGVVAGLLFSTSASLASDEPERRPENLRDLVRDETARLDETRTAVLGLRDDVDSLLAEQSPPDADPALAIASGRTAVTGPGVVVQLWDAPVPPSMPDGVTVDDLVVHQQDLEGVMNGLWAGGAEAMTVQGHRVTATTSVRCVGNVLLIDGATYSPPYEIAAIGDQSALREALLESRAVDVYLQYVDALNLGWSLDDEGQIEMPADRSNLTLEHAYVPG